MSPSAERAKVRRVLVALDASPGSSAAALAAARAAALLEVELVGLFVEDLDLLRLVRSPLAWRGDLLSARVGRLEHGDLEHELRAQAARAERSLTRAAGRAGVTCRFRVTRGPVTAEILSEAGEGDLVSLGRYGWTTRRRRTLGRTARALLDRGHTRALFVERREDLHAPMVVLVDGSGTGFEALEEAVDLAAPSASSLAILLLGAEPLELRRRVEERLAGKAPVARFYDLRHPAGAEGIATAVERLGAGLLVLPMNSDGEERLQELLERVDCPILVVS